MGKCFYHNEVEAVEKCSICEKEICKDCAVKHDKKIVCKKCGNKLLKQDHKKYKKDLKAHGGKLSHGKDFILPALIGIVLGVLVVFLSTKLSFTKDIYAAGLLAKIFLGTMLFVVSFGIPFGIVGFSNIFAERYVSTPAKIAIIVIRFIFALFFGWLIFIFKLIKLALKSRKKDN